MEHQADGQEITHPPGLKCMAMYCSSSEDNISLNESFVTQSRCFACFCFFCELRTAAVHHVGVIDLRDQGESAMAAASFKEKQAASHF